MGKRKSPSLSKDGVSPPPNTQSTTSKTPKRIQKNMKVHYSLSNFGMRRSNEFTPKHNVMRKHKSITTSKPLIYENRKFMKGEAAPVTWERLKALWDGK